MPFIHGKKTVVWYGGYDLSAFFNEASASYSVETAETTTFGGNAKTYITGLRDGTLSFNGLFDAATTTAVDSVLSTTLGADASDVVTFAPNGATVGQASISAQVKETSYEVSSPVGDVVSANLETQSDGGIDRGLLLAANTAVTTTGTGTAQDNAASTTNGGVGYLHVGPNTRNASGTFKVQHSSDNVTYADLITFTAVGATTVSAERIAVTGTINRYVRASHTIAGSTGSTTYTMAFARK